MLRSLKAKFVLAFGTLIIVLFTAMGLFLVDAKTRELSADIAQSSQSFAQFTVDRVMESYYELLVPGNFIQFTKQMNFTLRQAEQIAGVRISSYSGVVLYDSQQEEVERYDGNLRTVDKDTIDRVQSTKSSALLEDGRVIYIKIDENKNVSYVNFNEEEVEPLTPADRMVDIVVPVDNAYAVTYTVSYEAMEASLMKARIQIGAVAGIGSVSYTQLTPPTKA